MFGNTAGFNPTADLIYSIEMLEHLPRPHDFFANAFDAPKLGGYLLVTTPNLLHMTARMNYCSKVIQTMFAPPLAKPENAGRICVHIMPLGYGKIHAGLRKAGFADMTLHIDRSKRGAQILYGLYWPRLKLGSWEAGLRCGGFSAWPPLYDETGAVMEALNGHILTTTRSCIMLARKPTS